MTSKKNLKKDRGFFGGGMFYALVHAKFKDLEICKA